MLLSTVLIVAERILSIWHSNLVLGNAVEEGIDMAGDNQLKIINLKFKITN